MASWSASNDGEIFPGQGAFANFNVAKGLKAPQRVQVHVNVTVPAGHEVMIGATAEVVDLQTGATRFPVSPCGEPSPFALAMGTVGIVREEVVRLSLFHHLDPAGSVHPCLFKIALFGIDGKLLATDTGLLLSGQGAAFDYDLAKSGAPRAARAAPVPRPCRGRTSRRGRQRGRDRRPPDRRDALSHQPLRNALAWTGTVDAHAAATALTRFDQALHAAFTAQFAVRNPYSSPR